MSDPATPGKVRHPLLPARWPTREEAARALWFSPVRLGARVTAQARTWAYPHADASVTIEYPITVNGR